MYEAADDLSRLRFSLDSAIQGRIISICRVLRRKMTAEKTAYPRSSILARVGGFIQIGACAESFLLNTDILFIGHIHHGDSNHEIQLREEAGNSSPSSYVTFMVLQIAVDFSQG